MSITYKMRNNFFFRLPFYDTVGLCANTLDYAMNSPALSSSFNIANHHMLIFTKKLENKGPFESIIFYCKTPEQSNPSKF